jgi:hypothetical protein
MIIQALLNLVIFSIFMSFSFQAIQVINRPYDIDSLKLEYLQLQIDTLSSYYQGGSVINENICFNESSCIIFKNERIILTPGHQILIENVKEVYITKDEQNIIMNFLKNNQWVIIYVKEK